MSTTGTEQALRSLIAEVTGHDTGSLRLDDDLVDVLGIDSLAGLRVLAAVEKRFDVRLPDERLAEFRTLQSLLAIIDQAQGGAP